TDASGNTDTCDATVTVVDDIAPVIVCEGQAGSATYSGGAGEVLNNTLPPAVSTINVADDVTLDDVNVAINISHTWVSDLSIELESPAGTVVTLYSQANNISCSTDNIDATWDDDATVLADDSCNGSAPAISGLVLPTSALSAFNGESSLGDWTLTVTDGVGGDNGTLDGWDLILSSPDLALPALDVVLDVDGLATVNATDLLVSADDACGVNVTVGGGGAPLSLTTTFASNNGLDGNMFDINALNDVTINSFDINMNTGTDDVEVYFKTGTHVGFEGDASAWTLLDTATGITSNGPDTATPLNLNLGQVVLAGETVAFYVSTLTVGVGYTNGTTPGAVFASDANIEFLEGAGNAYPFGTFFTPRVFNGNIIYSEGTLSSNTIEFTCAEVGLNDVEVTVTDPSGNEST
ncbi:proprotein convertase P-domain-containing protein, partial [Patiriisocius hiemis]